MTLPTAPAAPAEVTARPADGAARPASVLRHRGCYWDVSRAAWVPWTPMPTPRPAQD
jgi:hypothetical protein